MTYDLHVHSNLHTHVYILTVYLGSNKELYLMQFPLKHMDTEQPVVDKARFKPRHRRLELQIPYPEHCINEDADDTHQSVLSHPVALKTNMGVGMIKDGAMYINGIKDVLQCRPSFKNLQPISRVSYSDVDEDDDDDDVDGYGGVKEKEDDEDLEKEDQEILQQVALKRKESGKAQALRLQSYSHVHAQEEAEEWQELDVYPLGTLSSEDAFNIFYDSHDDAAAATVVKMETNIESM